MLTQEEIIKKLYDSAKAFEDAFRKKQYARAKNIYDTAERVAVFVDIPPTHMQMLFMSQGDSEDKGTSTKWGAFNQDEVRKAYEECIKENQCFETKKYEETYFGK